MRFGPVALDAAEGGILAHAMRTHARIFKKGTRLGAIEIVTLRAAGVGMVTVAQIEPGDVEEDEAATSVALAICGTEIEVSPASTGRANLLAIRAGLVDLDPAAVDRLNFITEDVTLATWPVLAPIEAGRMVATVKIIPFAVRREMLDRCLAAASLARIRVLPFRSLQARLIHTTNAGLKSGVIAKTSEVTAERMARLGGSLIGERRCPHSTVDLGLAMKDALAAGCDLLLVIGASAIVDRRDVVPAAIEALGGRIERLGMPVDPGNLILMGSIGATPVLGLPGCARSPARNGLDWVLERIAAGVPVERDSVALMGVGGLLIGREEEKDYV